jgi:asparagine synthase (glutamine-hydrolysing)
VCGISVLIANTDSPEHAAALRAMHAPIRHRGPDDERCVVISERGEAKLLRDIGALDERPSFAVGMAFRRLKIVDLSEASAQPMASPDGTIWIVFNGEIYNFRELASELTSAGHSFISHGDTEVLLAAYEEWGTDCFKRLEGMWAVVIIDTRRGRVVASRDRFGIKPLYFAIDRQRLLFSSEIRQLLPVIGDHRVDANMVRAHVHGLREPVRREGFWLGIECVPPATYFDAPLRDAAHPPKFVPYWSLDDFTADNRRVYDSSLAELRETLRHAVASHSVADVPLGSLLSGGLDSAVVTSLLVEARGATFPTYSFGFRAAAPEACELPYVDDIVAMKKVQNHETTFDAPWIMANAERAITAMEEPPMALAGIAQFRTFELVKSRGTTVVLDGQGSDEIFAGYSYHERDLVLDRLQRGNLVSFYSQLRDMGRKHKRSVAYLIAAGLVKPWVVDHFKRYRWLLGDEEKVDFTNFDGARDASRLNRRLHFDVKWGNVRLVLGLGDRNSMAHSVECRVPYFDRRVVELAFALPDDFKIAKGDRKHIVRDIARQTLPPSLTERRDRMGYGAPTERFLRGPLREWTHALITDDRFASSPLFDRKGMLQFVDDYYAGKHSDSLGVWRLAALAVWQNAYDVSLG